MNLTEKQRTDLLLELGNLEMRVIAKLKRLKDEMGLSKKYRYRIHEGRTLLTDIQESINNLKSGHLEMALDKLYELTQKNLKLKSIAFPPDHKTFRQLRLESIRKNPEQLIKRSKSHGGGFRK